MTSSVKTANMVKDQREGSAARRASVVLGRGSHLQIEQQQEPTRRKRQRPIPTDAVFVDASELKADSRPASELMLAGWTPRRAASG